MRILSLPFGAWRKTAGVVLVAIMALATIVPSVALAAGKVGSVTVSSQSPNPVTAGSSSTYTITVNRAARQNGAANDLVLSASGIPAGVTASFSPSTVSLANGVNSATSTLTLSTTDSAVAGEYDFNITAQKNTDSGTGSGDLVIEAAEVEDTQAPVITVPEDITLEATNANGATVTFSATATDNVDEAVTVTCVPASGSVFPIGTTTVNCEAKDIALNVAQASFTITVTPKDNGDDGGGNAQKSITVTNNLGSGFGTVTSSDLQINCGTECTQGGYTANQEITLTASADANSEFTEWTGDCTGSSLTCVLRMTQDYVVNAIFTLTDGGGDEDTQAPVITVPANITVEATNANGASVTFAATATDNVDESVTVTCEPASGSVFPIGTTTVNCEAEDTAGNAAQASFTITVTEKTPGTDHRTLTVTIEGDGAVTSSPAGINCSGDCSESELNGNDHIVLTAAANEGSSFLEWEGDCEEDTNTTTTCTVHMSNDRDVIAKFSDEQAPVIIVPDDMTVSTTSDAGATVTFSATTTDNVDADGEATCEPASGSIFPIGTTTVNCNATDTAGNAAEQASFTVTVNKASTGGGNSGGGSGSSGSGSNNNDQPGLQFPGLQFPGQILGDTTTIPSDTPAASGNGQARTRTLASNDGQSAETGAPNDDSAEETDSGEVKGAEDTNNSDTQNNQENNDDESNRNWLWILIAIIIAGIIYYAWRRRSN